MTNTAMTQYESYGMVNQVDLSLGWQVNDSISATLGGRNIFDTYPDKGTLNTCCGQIYPDSSADWFGTYLYLNLNANF